MPEKFLKIVHINTHDIAGGAAKVAWRLAEAQRYEGHYAHMLVGYKNSNLPFSAEFDLDVNTDLQLRCQSEGLLYYGFQGSHNLPQHPWVREADLLHLHNLHGDYFNPFSLITLADSKPVVWTLHDMQSITGHCAHAFECKRWQTGCGNCPSLDTYPSLPIDSTARLWNDKKHIYEESVLNIVAPSFWLKSKLDQSILKNQHIEVIHNGINTRIFQPYPKEVVRAKFGLAPEALIIGSVAHGGAFTNEWKGGRDLQGVLDALWLKVPEMLFLNIGGKAGSGNQKFVNTGHVADENLLAQLYSCLDAFVYTPVADNCPLVELEALACGVPIVAFEVGGVPELVRSGVDGFIIKNRDIAAAVDAVLTLTSSRLTMSNISAAARERAVVKFDHAIITDRYEQIYLQAIDHHKPTIKIDTCNTKGRPSIQIISQKHQQRITLITPSFNQAAYLEECIDSILSQNYPNLEYIIMDGGSTDGSADIIKKYEKHLKHWQSQPDNGQYAAIDAGLRISTGTVMTWLNSDDVLHPGALKMVAELFAEQAEVSWITGRPNGLDPQGRQSWVLDMLPLWSREKYLSYEYYSPFIQQEGTFWCRRLWEKAGGYIRHDLKYAGDLELWTRFFRYAQLYSVDALIAGYRQHPQQKMAGFLEQYHQEAKAVLDFERELFQCAQDRQLRPAPLPIIPKQKDRYEP